MDRAFCFLRGYAEELTAGGGAFDYTEDEVERQEAATLVAN